MFCSVCGQKQQFNKKGKDFEIKHCKDCGKPYCKECGSNSLCKACIIDESSSPDYIRSLKKFAGSSIMMVLLMMLILFPLNVSAITTTGVISGFSMDDDNVTGATSYDIHASNDGTITGATTGATGKLNQAYAYDGLADYIQWGNGVFADAEFASGGSVSVWFNMTDNTGLKSLWAWPGRLYLRYDGDTDNKLEV